jgi:hypothetical protein
MIDKYLIRNSVFTVLLSQGFLSYLYKGFVQKNIIIQPNKIHHYFNSISRPEFNKMVSNNLRFGFVGNYRFPNTIMRFAEVIGKKFPQHQFYFFGDGVCFMCVYFIPNNGICFR